MNNIYSKVKKLDLSKWVLTAIYHYTSSVQDVIAEYDTIWHSKPIGDEYLKELYKHFTLIRNAYCDFKPWSTISENKTLFEIKNIENGEKYYLGQYDGIYSLGKSFETDCTYPTLFGKINQ